MPDSKDGDGKKKPTKKDVKQKIVKLKNVMGAELFNALKNPSSQYGGPVQISSGVPLKFPYTFTAKIVQFPLKFYLRNNWMWTYFFIAVIVSVPLFKKISNLANSPGNVEKWAMQQRKAQEAEHGH